MEWKCNDSMTTHTKEVNCSLATDPISKWCYHKIDAIESENEEKWFAGELGTGSNDKLINTIVTHRMFACSRTRTPHAHRWMQYDAAVAVIRLPCLHNWTNCTSWCTTGTITHIHVLQMSRSVWYPSWARSKAKSNGDDNNDDESNKNNKTANANREKQKVAARLIQMHILRFQSFRLTALPAHHARIVNNIDDAITSQFCARCVSFHLREMHECDSRDGCTADQKL